MRASTTSVLDNAYSDAFNSEKHHLRTISVPSSDLSQALSKSKNCFTSRQIQGHSRPLSKYIKQGSQKLLNEISGVIFVNKHCRTQDKNAASSKEMSDELQKNCENCIKTFEDKEIKGIATACKEIYRIITEEEYEEPGFLKACVHNLNKVLKNCYEFCMKYKKNIGMYKKSCFIQGRSEKQIECVLPMNKPEVKALNNTIESLKRSKLLEREQLLNKIALLESHISDIHKKYENLNEKTESEKTNEIDSLKKSLFQQFEKTLKEKDRAAIRLQYQISELNSQISDLNQATQFHKRKKTLTKLSLNEIRKGNTNLEERNRELKEQISMMSEELRIYLGTTFVLQKTQEQLRTFQRKITLANLNKYDGLDSNEDISIIVPNFQDRVMTRNRRMSNLRRAVPQSEDDKLIIETLKIPFPHLGEIIKVKKKNSMTYTVPFRNWLEITIRGIYDSKYYEHLMCTIETDKIPQKFPDFIYSWLNAFRINEQYREVQVAPPWKRGHEKTKKIFISALSESRANKSWEIETFKKFFLEEMQIDELEFFLRSRHLLFKGPELDIPEAKFAKVHYVQIDIATKLVDSIMSKFSKEEIINIKALLRSRAKVEKYSVCLNSAYVLRILLEYYRSEKQRKFHFIKSLFTQFPKEITETGDFTLSFRSFKDLCSKFYPNMPSGMIIKLFREAYSYGNGVLTPENFFIAANELGIFYRMVRTNRSLDDKKIQSSIQNSENIIKNSLALIKCAINKAGISSLLENFEYFEEVLGSGSNFAVDTRHIWSFAGCLRHFYCMAYSFLLSYDEINSFFSWNYNSINDEEVSNWSNLLENVRELMLVAAIRKIKKNVLIRKIQQKFRSKLKKNKERWLKL